MKKTLENPAKTGTMSTKGIGLQFFSNSVKDYKTITLPKQEYAHVMSELATHLTAEQHKRKVVNKAIGAYIYTVEVKGFGDYRVIGKKPIDSGKLDEIRKRGGK